VFRRFTLAILATTLTPCAAEAAWLANGPDGGSVASVTGSAGHLMVGTSDGVYASDDAGATWHRFGDMPRGEFVGALSVSPADPQIIMASASPAYRTIDGGAHWQPLATSLGQAYFHPLAPNFVVAIGVQQRLLCSDDGGATFTDTGRLASSLVAYPPGGISFLAIDEQSELSQSISGCSSWVDIGRLNLAGTPSQLLWDPNGANTLFILVDGLDWAGLERYDMNANTLNLVVNSYTAWGTIADPTTPGRLWFDGWSEGDTGTHVWESTDGGSAWLDLGAVLPDVGNLVGADASVAGRLYGNDNIGFAVSDDAGRTWTSRTQGIPLARTFKVSIRQDNPQHIVTDTRSGFVLTTDGGATWHPATTSVPFEVSSLVRSLTEPSVIFASGYNYDGIYRSTDDGDTWEAVGDPGDRDFYSIAVDHADSQKLAGVHGSYDALQWSDDGGVHWRTADVEGIPDLRQIVEGPPNSERIYVLGWVNDGVTYTYQVHRADTHGGRVVRAAATLSVDALAVHPADDRRLFAVTHDAAYTTATFYVSYDSGDHWQTRGTRAYASWTALRYDPCNPDTIYYQTPDALYSSTDEGMSWNSEALELPASSIEDFDVRCTAGTLSMAIATRVSGTQVREPQFIDGIFAGDFDGP